MENSKKVKLKKKWTVLEIILLCVLVVYSLTFFLALFWGVLTSLKEQFDFSLGNNKLFGLPSMLAWEGNFETPGNIFGNYVSVLRALEEKSFNKNWLYGLNFQYTGHDETKGTLWLYVFYTLLYAGGGSLIQVFVTSSVAYLCAKFKYKFSSIVYMTVIFTMIIPLVGAQTAMINILQMFNLYNNWLGHFLRSAMFNSMYFLVFYSFFTDMSDSYIEAAEIDGASQLRVMFSVCMPLAIKMITTIFLIMFVAGWNDYTTPLLYLPTNPTLSTALFYLINFSGLQETPSKIAALFMLCLPILVLFIIFKKTLMGNVSMGGVKE